jgi:DNA ligase (NAD+)
MLSLDKCYTEDELLRWYARFEGPAVVTHKIDGLAVSLRYDGSGALQLAATRGDGVTGEVITANLRRVAGVPQQLRPGTGSVEVRGEAYMPLSVFHARYAGQFANPRNLAAGALKQKNPERTAEYGLRFLAYDLTGDSRTTTEADELALLHELGFEVPDWAIATADSAQQAFETLRASREALDFETDGVVFKVNDLAQQDSLGNTAHHPRGAIAYKYQGESGFSRLRGIEWSVSRTGAINPVALIEPVSLSGVTVGRVSLHNLGIMERLGAGAPMRVGSRLLVTRRGGVIPHVEQVVDAGDGEPLSVPGTCPSCGGEAYRRDDFLFAHHAPDCVTAASRRLLHFAAAIDLEGFGPRLVEQLLERGLVREPADFFALSTADLRDLDRMGERSAEKLVASVAARATLRFSTFLAALGIPEVGAQVARSLEREFSSLDDLLDASEERLTSIAGIGPSMSASIRCFSGQNRDWVTRLASVVRLGWPAVAPDAGPLAGQRFVFTGKLETLERSAAQERVRALGGLTPSSVSSEVDFLVIGDDDHAKLLEGRMSSKLSKAVALRDAGSRIQIIPEREFLAMLTAADRSRT